MGLGVGPHLLGAHFDTAPVDKSTGRFLELYIERAGDAIGRSGRVTKVHDANGIRMTHNTIVDGRFPRGFTPSKPYAEAVTARPRAVARAILQMFRGMSQPTNIAFQSDMKAEQFTIRQGVKDDAAFEMRTVDPPLFVGGPVNSKYNKARLEAAQLLKKREQIRLIKLKRTNCRLWNVQIACRNNNMPHTSGR
jgi:hypothetical protein